MVVVAFPVEGLEMTNPAVMLIILSLKVTT